MPRFDPDAEIRDLLDRMLLSGWYESPADVAHDMQDQASKWLEQYPEEPKREFRAATYGTIYREVQI